MNKRPGLAKSQNEAIKRVSIITVCRNAEKYIEETMRSVLDQTAVKSGRVDLEYIVLDGLSTDKTVSIAKKVGGTRINLESAADRGLYDALSRGLRMSSGDVIAYINAGDYYHKCAFDVVIDVMENKGVSWLTGLSVWYNDKSQLVRAELPYRYRAKAIQTGLHGKKLPFIQQESTFWRRSLHRHLNFERLSGFRLAGDAYLWNTFSRHTSLAIVCAHIGGFRIHSNQLSSCRSDYLKELSEFSGNASFLDKAVAYIDKVVWHMPISIKKKLNKKLLTFDHNTGDWL